MKKFALVQKGIVKNVIVADEEFILNHCQDYDHQIDVTEMVPYPGPGWFYDGENFLAPLPESESE